LRDSFGIDSRVRGSGLSVGLFFSLVRLDGAAAG
jgi:hypothetical protein